MKQRCSFSVHSRTSLKKVWYFIPLVLVEIVAIVLADFSPEVTVEQYIALLFFAIAVGFNEEIYFRGIVYHFMLVKGSKTAVISSAVIFGVLHLVNAFRNSGYYKEPLANYNLARKP